MQIKRKVMLSCIVSILLVTFFTGCAKAKVSIPDFVKLLKDEIGYDVEYIEDRSVIRITDYLGQDAIIDAVSNDNVYNQWIGLRENILKLYDDSVELAKSKNIDDTEFEIVIIEKDSAKTSQEIPLLIINKDGVLLDIVEEIRSK